MAHHAAILEKLSSLPNVCRALPFCDPPISGESLSGFLTRNVARHGIDRVAPALSVAGIHTLVPEAISTMHIDKAPEIASLLRTTPDEITMRCHPRVELPGRPDSFLNFFGTSIRSAYREVKRRRVSPLSLQTSPHHRALWDLRVLSFCPDSRETLISDCPACGKGLGWRWTLGIAHCEHCGADLREYPQPVIEVADLEALDFVVDLVHPDPARKARVAGSIPPALAPLTLDNGELFEFVIGVACAVATEPDAPRAIMRRLQTLDDFAKLTPDVLSRAGRVILGWPGAFHGLAENMRAKADARTGAFWGKKKELGPLLHLARDAYLSPEIKSELHLRIDENMAAAGGLLRRAEQRCDNDLLTIAGAAAEFGVNRRAVAKWVNDGHVWSMRNHEARRTIVLVRRAEIAEMVSQRTDAIGAEELRRKLGVDPIALNELAEAGLIRKVAFGIADKSLGDCYSRSSVNGLMASLAAAAGSPPKNREGAPLSKATKCRSTARVPWLTIFHAILDGRLHVHHLDPAPECSFVDTLAVFSSDDVSPFLSDIPPQASGAASDRMSGHEAAALIMTNVAAISALIKGGILATNGEKERKLDRTTVEAFRRDFILCNEIAHRCKWEYAIVRSRLADRGIEPVHNADRSKHLVWARADVEAAIADIIEQGEEAMRSASDVETRRHNGATWNVDILYLPASGIDSRNALIVSDADSGMIIDARVKDGEFTAVDVIDFLSRQMVEHGSPDAIRTVDNVFTRSLTLTQWCVGFGIDRVFRPSTGGWKYERRMIAVAPFNAALKRGGRPVRRRNK